MVHGRMKKSHLTFLTVTQNETERMIRLVNDLLQLSKMDSKDYQLSKGWVNFNEFYNHIIDRLEMTKNEDITFVRDIPKDDSTWIWMKIK